MAAEVHALIMREWGEHWCGPDWLLFLERKCHIYVFHSMGDGRYISIPTAMGMGIRSLESGFLPVHRLCWAIKRQ